MLFYSEMATLRDEYFWDWEDNSFSTLQLLYQPWPLLDTTKATTPYVPSYIPL